MIYYFYSSAGLDWLLSLSFLQIHSLSTTLTQAQSEAHSQAIHAYYHPYWCPSGAGLNEQLKFSFTTHTFTLKPTWGLTLTVTHTLTHHSLYKSSVKVENDNTIHIKYLILIVAQLSNS